ncbi:MAG: DUF6588 family protein [Cytophagales bacterium]
MKKIFLSICVCAGIITCEAQKNIAKFFPLAAVPSGGETNLQNVVTGYIQPIAEDYGQVANNGWYTTASVHKRWGFDFNVTVSTISVQSKSETFAAPVLAGVSYLGGTTPLQTAYGKEGVFPSFQYTTGSNSQIIFRGADGAEPGKDLPIGSLAVPNMQLGLGIFQGTELRLRFTPAIKIKDTELGNWGVGIVHDIKQHIPGWNELPFSLSLFAGYMQSKATTSLSGFYSGSGQEGIAQSSSYTAQLLIGKDMKVLSLYAAVGYNGANTDFKINGTYVVNTTDSGEQLKSPVTLNNPFTDSYSTASVRATAGIRLKFGPITLNTDYTRVSAQNIIAAGFGITVN